MWLAMLSSQRLGNLYRSTTASPASCSSRSAPNASDLGETEPVEHRAFAPKHGDENKNPSIVPIGDFL